MVHEILLIRVGQGGFNIPQARIGYLIGPTVDIGRGCKPQNSLK